MNDFAGFHERMLQKAKTPAETAYAERRAAAKAIACPKCGAAPGVYCVTANGNDHAQMHGARWAQSQMKPPKVITYDTRLDVLGLSVRARNAFKSEKIETVADLLLHTRESLLRIPNLGRKSLAEVEAIIGRQVSSAPEKLKQSTRMTVVAVNGDKVSVIYVFARSVEEARIDARSEAPGFQVVSIFRGHLRDLLDYGSQQEDVA